MAPQALIRLPVVMARTGMSRSEVYRREKLGQFPKRISLGGGENARSVAWVAEEIDDYIKALIAESRNSGGTERQRHSDVENKKPHPPGSVA